MPFRQFRLFFPFIVLAALSACKEERTLTPTPVDPALVVGGAPVDPLCFIQTGGSEEAPSYATQNCGGGEYVADTENPAPLDDEFVSRGYFFVDAAMPEQKFPGFIGYKYLGEYRGLKAIQIIENGGGSGIFTSVQLLRPEKDGTLRLIQTLAGGDRCNGGIAESFMDKRTLVYDVNLTPFDFLTVAEYNPRQLQAYDDLDSCAVCCYATLRFVNGQAESVSLNPEAPLSSEGGEDAEKTLQTCFDRAFGDRIAAQKINMSLKEFKKFVVSFHGMCTAP